jgi:glycosyltransferase involved in cell wall biosynthesis
MKIGLAAPIWYPIPPVGYGGIEMIVSLLAEGLTARGHDVTLFASGDSKTDANLVSSYDIAPSAKIGQVYPDLINSLTVYENAADFDIIHDHSGIIGPTIGAFVNTPVLHTLHGPATPEAKSLYRRLNFGLYFNAISESQRQSFGDLKFVATIHNAIDLDGPIYSEDKDDYLLFVGRMNPEKGAHLAVEAANKLGRRLVMVTKMAEPQEQHYFKYQVEPLLNSNIEVLGEIGAREKAHIFSRAACTLFPIEWPEPFGLVMIESLAAGTPVIAMRNGAVPEVIEDGRTGFIVESVDEMVAAVDRVPAIEPRDCRRSVEEKFSAQRMVEQYEHTYWDVLDITAAQAA